jgi:anti-sigma regulatory factor (Ser/Thr protein kinase)
VDITLTNDLAELSRMADSLEAYARDHGVADGTLFAVNLALEELVTNTISYGYADGGRHVITISLVVDGPHLHVRIDDDATEFNPLEFDAPDLEAPLEDRRVGGLGVHLVRTLMDDIRYERVDGRNVLSMRKRLDGAAPV